MADKQVWIGSVGPLLYDDVDEYDPVNEPGKTIQSIRAEGTVEANDLVGTLQGYNEGLKSHFLL